jgi:hypothetical protein
MGVYKSKTNKQKVEKEQKEEETTTTTTTTTTNEQTNKESTRTLPFFFLALQFYQTRSG